MDRRIKSVRQLEQAFDPYCLIFKELGWGGVGGLEEAAPITRVLHKFFGSEGRWD
jgi:hypothetical protein